MSPNLQHAPVRSAWRSLLAGLLAASCSGGSGDDPNVASVAFTLIPSGETLQLAEYDALVQAAAEAIDSPNVAIAVVDRIGNILRVWNRNPSAPGDEDNRIAVSIARTAAFLSHSQAPLPSRTEQFISTFHFPAQFALDDFGDPDNPFGGGPERRTVGVENTPQGPLWQIQNTNRGSLWADPLVFNDPLMALPQLVNSDGSVPSPGLTPLPGGIPIYKCVLAGACVPPGLPSQAAPPPGFDLLVTRRLVGGLGVYVTTDPPVMPLPEVAEFAAATAVLSTLDTTTMTATGGPENSFFYLPNGQTVPTEGGVYLVGVLLPAVEQTTRPAGVLAGTYSATLNVDLPAITTDDGAGAIDPFGTLIGPDDSGMPLPPVGLTMDEVQVLIDSTVEATLETHAAIRLPAKSPCSMSIAITDLAGTILALHRMNDGTLFSIEIAIAKARETVYFSNAASVDFDGPRAGQHPLAGIVPPGTAITARTLGFLTQPFFPPGIDGTPPGPLFELVLQNADPLNFDRMGFAPPGPNQSGLVLFPGSAPLYKNGVLVGAIGVSGDGVEQDDYVTALGIAKTVASLQALGNTTELVPPAGLRCDEFSFQDVTLPYMKFPQNPGG